MNRVATEPVSPGDDLDGLLRAYFQAEVPTPWPRFQPPVKAQLLPFRAKSPAPPRWTSRAALVAAAVLLLLALALLPRPKAGGDRSGVLPILDPGSATPGRGLPLPIGGPRPGLQGPDKVKSSLHLEQGDDGRTGFKITVEELPPDR